MPRCKTDRLCWLFRSVVIDGCWKQLLVLWQNWTLKLSTHLNLFKLQLRKLDTFEYVNLISKDIWPYNIRYKTCLSRVAGVQKWQKKRFPDWKNVLNALTYWNKVVMSNTTIKLLLLLFVTINIFYLLYYYKYVNNRVMLNRWLIIIASMFFHVVTYQSE